jgi:hypothetical protein
MIEPSGSHIDVLGVPNRQSKVPMGQSAARQETKTGSPQEKAHDDPSFGKVGTGGMYDNPIGKTMLLDECAMGAGHSGSNASKFSAPLSPLNKGDGRGKSGESFASPELRSSKAQGQHPRPGRGDIGVAGSSASQEALISNPGLAD